MTELNKMLKKDIIELFNVKERELDELKSKHYRTEQAVKKLEDDIKSCQNKLSVEVDRNIEIGKSIKLVVAVKFPGAELEDLSQYNTFPSQGVIRSTEPEPEPEELLLLRYFYKLTGCQ